MRLVWVQMKRNKTSRVVAKDHQFFLPQNPPEVELVGRGVTGWLGSIDGNPEGIEDGKLERAPVEEGLGSIDGNPEGIEDGKLEIAPVEEGLGSIDGNPEGIEDGKLERSFAGMRVGITVSEGALVGWLETVATVGNKKTM